MRPRDQHWPYIGLPAEREGKRGPTWHCPDGICVCDKAPEDPLIKLAIRLYDHDSHPMPGARFRVWRGSQPIDERTLYADASGTINIEVTEAAERLMVEWAPHNTPWARHLPYRRVYHVVTGSTERERIATRLSHAGYYLGSDLSENVRQFQRAYGHMATGHYEDVAAEIVEYHDRTGLPPTADEAHQPLAPTSPPRCEAPTRPDQGILRERDVTAPFEVGIAATADEPWTDEDWLVIVDSIGNVVVQSRLGDAERRDDVCILSFTDYERNHLYTAKVLFKLYEYVIYEHVPIYDLLSRASPYSRPRRPVRPYRLREES